MSDLKAAIRQLQKAAKPLDPPSTKRGEIRQAVTRYTEQFLETLPAYQAFCPHEGKEPPATGFAISEQPTRIGELLNFFEKNVNQRGLKPASAGHLAYIPGGGIYYASLGDYLAAISNEYAGIHFAGPGAVEMENELLAWMARLAGYPERAGGTLTSSGSIANLVAIVTARDAFELKGHHFPKAVVYTTSQAHHCLDKALRIAGLGECIRRSIPVDVGYRMRPDALEARIRKDRQQGLIPWMVMASAGTTDVGAVDPLEAIGKIARAERLWYHIDGAYGAFFALTEIGKEKLRGMELSDSIVMDPHKGLFLPYGIGAVIIKDQALLHRSHYYQANYLQDADQPEHLLSPAEVSPELTRHFRGLRMWLPLKLLGLPPFQAALEEKLLLARYFHREIQKIRGFEVGPEPELSVVTYRFVPKAGDANAFNRELIKSIHRDGRVFLSSTMLRKRFTLRLAVLCFRTHLDTIDQTLAVLQTQAHAMEAALF